MFNGKVNISSMGRIIALITPKNIEPIIAAQTVSSKPGRITAVKIMAKIFNSHLITQPLIIL